MGADASHTPVALIPVDDDVAYALGSGVSPHAARPADGLQAAVTPPPVRGAVEDHGDGEGEHGAGERP